MTSAPRDLSASIEQRTEIKARLAAGALPARKSDQKIYAGYGDDKPCDGCGRVMGKTDVAYEIECLGNSESAPLTMHLRCFAVWTFESQATN